LVVGGGWGGGVFAAIATGAKSGASVADSVEDVSRLDASFFHRWRWSQLAA
jgi:hypothetical protein